MKTRSSWPKIKIPGLNGIRRRKIRLLYKIWAFSIPLFLLTLGLCIMKMYDSCFGGCPFLGNQPVTGPDGQTYMKAVYGPTDFTTGLGLMIIPGLIGIILIYMPGYVAGYWEHDN